MSRLRCRSLATALTIATLIGFPLPAHAAGAGSLDTSFSGDGKLTLAVGTWSGARAVASQPDGKIVVAGYSYGPDVESGFAVARLNADGSLDTSFSGDGQVVTMVGPSSVAYAVALQPDGKIVVAGVSTGRHGDRFALARYNTDGSLDDSFAGDGMRITSFIEPYSGDFAQSLAIQPDGKIVVAGETDSERPTGGYDVAIARYTEEGALDTSFSRDGKLTTSFGTRSSYAEAVAVGTDGAIVVAGFVYGNSKAAFALARYAADGSLDPSFSENGKLTTAIGSYSFASSIALGQDGTILAAGSSGGLDFDSRRAFALARYTADGSLDTSFDTDGIRTARVEGSSSASSVQIQPDGKIVAAGTTDGATGSYDFALARFNPDGSIDLSFSADGKTSTSLSRDDYGNGVVIQPDGTIVVVGGSSPNVMGLARFLAA